MFESALWLILDVSLMPVSKLLKTVTQDALWRPKSYVAIYVESSITKQKKNLKSQGEVNTRKKVCSKYRT